MTTVQTRVRCISNLEGFDITTTQNGAAVPVQTNGALGDYSFKRKLKGSATVDTWRRERFEATYPGYSCIVLKGDGTVAAGQMTLKALRATYP